MKTTKFKPSEVGPIPEEWEVKRLGECCNRVKNGFAYDFREHGEFPVSRIETISSGKIDYHRVGMIETPPPEEYLVKNGDILYSHINSLPYIGNVAQYEGGRPLYHGMNLLLLRPADEVDAHYLHYVLASEPLRRRARMAAKVAINQASINTSELKNFPIRFPPRPEQEKIAEALSDVDALLAAMTTLIEKKWAIKQGAMQQLLSGRKRLAGFTDKWVEKRLGEIADFVTATTPTATIDLKWYIGTENMLAEKAGVIQNDAEVPYKAVREYLKGDVLTSNIRPYLKKIWLADRDGGCSTDVLVIRTHDASICIPEFLVMLISDDAFFDFAMANAVGTKMPRGDKKVLVNFEVTLPPIDEQRAIAAVLSDMDAEIAALEAKRAKYESIKQGMMQELLTGRTRLI